MLTPLVSIITPTHDRPDFLPRIYAAFVAQDVEPLEWIVVDDSEAKSDFMSNLADPRVRYVHLPARTPLGEKRNIAVEQATAPIIAQFDDDDYYAPGYLRIMTSFMENGGVDFVKLTSFFVYSKVHKQFGYWDLLNKDAPSFIWSSSPDIHLTRLPPSDERDNLHLGFGFSYVFRRKVWEAGKFPARSWGEDTPLLWAAMANGFNVHLLSDQTGLCLHMTHATNSSTSFPQYILPDWLAHRFFPGLDASLL
jgi:glycosyltransferase involved in cell wall biosynthesis